MESLGFLLLYVTALWWMHQSAMQNTFVSLLHTFNMQYNLPIFLRSRPFLMYSRCNDLS